MGYFVKGVNSYSTLSCSRDAGEGSSVSLVFDREGKRKYLTVSERTAFLGAAALMPAEARTFCTVLAYSGARVSEVLALTAARIDLPAGLVVFESLKKRRRGMYRAVPIPGDLLSDLDKVHAIVAARQVPELASRRLWPWSRTTGWSRVKEAMAAATVVGPQATPKGLRHGFAVAALQAEVPINFVRRWLGHARLSTTEIYADAVGEEERAIAARFWETF